MNAEIGIDEEGKAYVTFNTLTDTEWNLLRYLQPWLPIQFGPDGMPRFDGDKLPGSGKGA